MSQHLPGGYMLIQKIGYFAVGVAATVLLQQGLRSSRARALRAASSNGRVIALADWKRRKPIRAPSREFISED